MRVHASCSAEIMRKSGASTMPCAKPIWPLRLRANEASILYNAACTYCVLKKKQEALDALRKAWEAGFKDASGPAATPIWLLLHGDPVFERLYPATKSH